MATDRLEDIVNTLHDLCKKQFDRYSNKYSRHDYEIPQKVVVYLVGKAFRLKLREMEVLFTHHKIIDWLGLEQCPDHVTLGRVQDLMDCRTLRLLLARTVQLFDSPGSEAALDATWQLNRRTSTYYSAAHGCPNSTKTTYLVDIRLKIVLDVHQTTSAHRHDTQIAPPLLKRNLQRMDRLYADRGYDDMKLRRLCMVNDCLPLILFREGVRGHELNDSFKEMGYHRRSTIEGVIHGIKSKYGSYFTSRTWHRRFQENLIKAIMHNLEQYVGMNGQLIIIRVETRPSK